MSRLKSLYHYFLAWLGSIVYGHPSEKLFVIGVTGTKGKTTTVELLHSVLGEAGLKTALLSSVHVKFGNEVRKNPKSNTMPGRFFIQHFLAEAVKKGCTHAIVEVTSQGVVQHRHRFIDFNVAAMTCLHAEHIESHGSFENYREAKVDFFRYTANESRKKRKIFVINSDSSESFHFRRAAEGKGEIVSFSREQFIRDCLFGDSHRAGDWLSSDFNLENAAAADAICRVLDIPAGTIVAALAHFKGVPGRQEFVVARDGRTAVIDYALTPDSLEAIHSYLKKLLVERAGGGRLLAVFGSAGGGRDTWKRPALGKVAEIYADIIYLTTDDSYDEDSRDIIDDIAGGIMDKGKIRVIIDRKKAIAEALREARPQDIVAITGMGSQSYTYGPRGAKQPWSERQAVEEVLQSL